MDEGSSQPVDLTKIWDLCLALLATRVSRVTFSSYVESARLLSVEGDVATLGVASPFAREWLDRKAANAIRSALEFYLDQASLQLQMVVLSRDGLPAAAAPAEAGEPGQTVLPLDPENTPPAARAAAGPRRANPSRSAPRRPAGRPSPPSRTPCLPLNERYTLATFQVGDSNRLAHAGASSVASRPGEVYNPLFLFGPPGTGKTHLLHAIAQEVRKRWPEAGVAYMSAEFFAQEYVTSLRDGITEQFRRRYREVDVWLVDDVQFIVGKRHTNEEFFHTFDALYQRGRQIVISSDRTPRELQSMDERLRSRFQSGLIADISAPDVETRISILRQFRQREEAVVPDNVLDYIASAIHSNVRALEGALTRLIAYSSVMGAPPTEELAQTVLGEYFINKPVSYRKVTVDEVIELIAKHFGHSPDALRGSARNKDISAARQVAIYVCRQVLPELSTSVTGAAFGGRDHATVLYACQRVKQLIDADPEIRSLVRRAIESLSA